MACAVLWPKSTLMIEHVETTAELSSKTITTVTTAWETLSVETVSISMGDNGYSSVYQVDSTWGALLPALASHIKFPPVNDKKKLPVYAPCVLRDYTVPPREGRRRPKNLKNANVARITALVFDVDNANANAMQSPLQATTWLHMNSVAHAYHSSWSSTAQRPKFRIVVPITKPVVLESNEDRKSFKLAYERAMVLMGIDGDVSCSDAAQYFIGPAIPDRQVRAGQNTAVALGPYEEGKAWFGDWKPGQAFDLAALVDEARKDLKSQPNRRKTVPKGQKGTTTGSRVTQKDLKTRGLFAWNSRNRLKFQVEAFIEHYESDGIRGPATSGGLHCRCPNQTGDVTGRAHTDPSDTSTSFWVRNPQDGQGYVIKCHTQGCTEHFAGDPLLYLDELCVRYEIQDASALDAFVEGAQREGASGNDQEGAEETFRLNDDGDIRPNEPFNIRLAVKRMGITLTFNELTNRARVDGLWDRGTDLDDAAMNRFRLRMKDDFDFLPSKELFADVISDLARQASFHPVKDYLDEMQGKWDGVSRIERLLIDYFGAEDTPFNRAAGRLWMTAAVRRMRCPGCKFDELLVLISGQGAGKSSGIAAITGPQEWFTDCLPMNAPPKETIEQTRGKWIGEIAELQGNHREVETIKAFLSRQVDTARGAFGRLPEDVKRSFVCIGTTNSEQFLKDRTGNRRFWPVKVGEIDLAGIKRDRDQLWAEAAALEAADPSDNAIRLDRSLWSAAGEAQQARLVVNPYKEALEAALGDRVGRITTEDVYRLLGVAVDRRHQTMMELVADAMKELGWEKRKVKFSGLSLNGYLKGTEGERSLELSLVKDDTTGRLKLAPEDLTVRMIATTTARPSQAPSVSGPM